MGRDFAFCVCLTGPWRAYEGSVSVESAPLFLVSVKLNLVEVILEVVDEFQKTGPISLTWRRRNLSVGMVMATVSNACAVFSAV